MRLLPVIAVALATLAACSRGERCLTQDDCDLGTYCDRGGASGFEEGTCVADCVVAADCPVSDPAQLAGLCDNTGRCQVTARPPRLRVLEPENDTLLDEGSREIRLVGEVETTSANVRVEISPQANNGCVSGEAQTITLTNPSPGVQVKLSFASALLPLDPGLTTLSVRASVQGSVDSVEHDLEIPCPGCAPLSIAAPRFGEAVAGLTLPRLEGTVGAPAVRDLLWRVRSERGEVIDGSAGVAGGRFAVTQLPLFAGQNRVQVVVTGVGGGLGESRCSTFVSAGSGRERGLRALMVWDGPTSDLDLHLVGPGGRFGDPASDLAPRGGRDLFGGQVVDDFDGRGPETITAAQVADGDYGVVVEPVFDADDPGANTFLRILWDGRLLVTGPIGPAFLSSLDGRLWIAGVVRVSGGTAEWRALGEYLPLRMPPTRPPSDWPTYY